MNPALRSVHSWRKSPVWSFKSSYRPTCLPSVSVVCCFARLLEIYPVPSLPIPWRGGFLFLTYPYTAFGPRGLSVCEREPCLQGPMHQTSTGLSPLLHTHSKQAPLQERRIFSSISGPPGKERMCWSTYLTLQSVCFYGRPLLFRSQIPLTLYNWHTVHVSRTGRLAFLTVDDQVKVNVCTRFCLDMCRL